MKKILSLAMVCLLVVAFTTMAIIPASAASAQDTIIAALKENIPAKYLEEHLPVAENILKQLEITDEQAAEIVACIKAANDAVDDHHTSLSEFTAEEREVVLEKLDEACEILEVRYETKNVEDPAHKGDVYATFYKEDGAKLADVDFDAVKKTNVADEMNVEYAVLAVVLMVGAVVAAVYGKKALAA